MISVHVLLAKCKHLCLPDSGVRELVEQGQLTGLSFIDIWALCKGLQWGRILAPHGGSALSFAGFYMCRLGTLL